MLRDQHLLSKADIPAKGLPDACRPRKSRACFLGAEEPAAARAAAPAAPAAPACINRGKRQGALTRGSCRIAVPHVTCIKPRKLTAAALENAKTRD